MAAQVALKRQQAAEDAIVLGLRACSQRDSADGEIPMMTPGPLWGPESKSNDGTTKRTRSQDDDEGMSVFMYSVYLKAVGLYSTA